MQEIQEKAAQIKLVIFDVDGVLTSGDLFIGDDGQEYKAFNSKDGHGMVMLQSTGVRVAIITGRTSQVVEIRMQGLGVKHIYQGQRDKLPAYEELKISTGLTDQQIAYVGDDVVDLPVMKRVGLAVAVQDAHPLTKSHAHWVTQACGGKGAAREFCELIMESQGSLQTALERYFQ